MQKIDQNLKSVVEKLLQIESPQHDYQVLMNKRQFAEASAQIEELLLTDNIPKHKLAWILCQFAWSQVPVVTLVSPLEEIFPQIQEQPDLFEFAGGVYLEIGIALIKQERLRLAVVVLEEAFSIIQRLERLSKAEKTKVLRLLIDTFQDELAKAERRREDKKYIEELNNKLETFQKTVIKESPASKVTEKPQATTRRPKKSSKKTQQNFSAKSLLQNFDEEDKKNSELKDEQEPKDTAIPADKHAKPQTQTLKLHHYLIIIVAGLSLGALFYFAIQKVAVLEDIETNEYLALEMSSGLQDDLGLPVLEPIKERHDTNAALGAIALKKVEDRLQQGGRIIEFITKSNSANKVSEQPKVAMRSSAPHQTSHSQNSYPEIVPKYEQYYGNYGEHKNADNSAQEYKDPDQVPNLDPKTAAVRKVDIIESGERRIDTTGLYRDRDGRIYGDPSKTIDVNKTVNSGARKNIKSFYVQQYNPPIGYTTIVDVTVLSSPSAISYSIAELPKGSDIKVSAYMGPWLEIISYKGRKGYIYTQDAVKK
jgi:hypothetical protein